MKNIFYLFITFSILVLASCSGSENPQEEEAILNVTVEDLSTPKDPVCGMSVANRAIADTAHHQGKVYGFCNPGCKKAFAANPGEFLDEI